MRTHLRLASLIGAAALTAVAAAPATAATAATNVARADANALQLSVAGNGDGTGTVTAVHDGTTEKLTGVTNPPISVLKNQSLLNVGVLAQEATATEAGHSAACAGVAGEGGSVAQVGSSRCLTPGKPVDLSLTNLDFSKVDVIDPASALGPLAQANEPLRLILDGITKPLREGLAATPLAPTGLGGTLGAVQASCLADPGSASGTANIVDTKLTLDIAGHEAVIADLPAHPAPNTEVPVHLEQASKAIVDAVTQQLTTMLTGTEATPPGPLAPLAALPQALQDQVIVALADATRDQLLQPVQDNLLKLTLNRQTRTGADHIKVTALDLEVLPAAREQLGADLVQLQLGTVECGPNSQVAAPQAGQTPEKPAKDDLPTAVSAGLAGSDQGGHTDLALGALAVLLLGGTAAAGFRRLRD